MTIRRLVALLMGALLLAGLSGPAHALAPTSAPEGVSGRLIAPNGSPQAGALVRLLDTTTGSTAVTTTSAPDGSFAFSGAQRPEKFVVQVCQDLVDDPCVFPPESLDFVKLYVGPAGREFSLPALTSYFETNDSSPAVALGDVQLTRPGTIVVKVTNGLKLSFRRLVNVSSMQRPYNRSSLAFEGLAPGRHLVRAFGQRRLVTVGAGQTVTTVISKRQPQVTGRVVLDGRPVRNSPVTLTGADDRSPAGIIHQTRTGADGRYAFPGLPFSNAPWRLRIGSDVSASGTHALAPGTPHRYLKFKLAGSQRKTVDLITRSSQRGSLWVRYTRQPAGPALRRAALLTLGGELVGRLPIRKDRSMVAGLVPGHYIVAMRWFPTEGIQQADWDFVHVRARDTAKVALSPAKGPGRLTVQAPPGAQVSATALFPGGASSSLREFAAAERTRTVPASGKVVFGILPTGSYRIYMPRVMERPDETLTRLVDGNTSVDLTTPTPEASIRGQLVNPATGQPWPWTRVIADTLNCYGDYDGGSERIEDGGFIVVDELHTGTYSCELVGFWADRGTPYAGTNGFFRPVTGTYPATSGQQLDRDFPVPFVPAGG